MTAPLRVPQQGSQQPPKGRLFSGRILPLPFVPAAHLSSPQKQQNLISIATPACSAPPTRRHTPTHNTQTHARAPSNKIKLAKGTYLKPQGSRGQRRPRDLRLRALDPLHFTCPPPAHGETHQRRPGAAPAEGHASVLAQDEEAEEEEKEEEGAPLFSIPSAAASSSSFLMAVPSAAGARAAGGPTAAAAAEAAAAGAEAAAAAAAAAALAAGADAGGGGVVPDLHEMYHLDAASLDGFVEAAAAATRALESLLSSVSEGSSNSGGEGRGGSLFSSTGGLLPPTGVASLLLGADGGGGGGGQCGAAVVEAIADVRDTFRELVVAAASLGVVVPCAPDGAGKAKKELVRSTHKCLPWQNECGVLRFDFSSHART